MRILRSEFCFTQSLGPPEIKPHCLSGPNALGAHLLSAGTWGGQRVKWACELLMRQWEVEMVGEPLHCHYSPV